MLSAVQREKLEALRRRFADRLPGMVLELEEACRAPEKLEEAIRRAHTLAGTAGTFGLTELGRLARALEILLREGGAASATDDLLRELRARLP